MRTATGAGSKSGENMLHVFYHGSSTEVFSNRRICPTGGREVGFLKHSAVRGWEASDHEGKDSHDNAGGGNNRIRFVCWSRRCQVGQRVMLDDKHRRKQYQYRRY